jgi:hypothetical protein
MENIKVSLFDNDHVVHAITEGSSLDKIFKKIREEFITGETAYLEVEGLRETPIVFEISPME